MALISLEHVSKVYPKGTRPALDDINLDINRGDFVFLSLIHISEPTRQLMLSRMPSSA